MPLFNPKTIETALRTWERNPSEAERDAAARWAGMARDDFGGQNESQIEPEFNAVLMQGALGYRPLSPDAPGTIKAKQPIAAGTVDLALGRFTAGAASIVAPVELKGPRTGLDSIMAGRAKTPVQQAWDYASDAAGARWVLVSNMRELRLYAFGHGRAAHESFDLRRIDEPAELRRLQLLVHADQLLGDAAADLLARSASEDRDITNALYADYKRLRDDLLQFVRDQRPQVVAETRIALVQKLLDRLIFIAFAEDSVLVPDDSIRRAVEFVNPYDPQPRWRQVRRLFDAVDTGAAPLGIPPYNGGLFARDPELDALDLPDPLVERFLDISKYDFKSQISVTILGHIFEQSISDIEALQAEARGEPPPRTTTRKRFGVVYTPDFVTRFIVEQTIGAHLREIGDALLVSHADGVDAGGEIAWRAKTSERDYWRAYLGRLTTLRVLDPACGSGAFLVAAFDFLHAEQKRVRERLGEVDGGILVWADQNADAEIITANLHGVDVNRESVEITKLALWLKTAKRGRPLGSLELNIQWGNSLIEDSDFHSRAFVWRSEFATIFAEGGFDLVIGNPPYVRMELLKPIKPYLETRYAVVSDRADLYAYFFELGVKLLRPGGRLGYISSSTFFRTGSGAPLRRYLAGAAEIEAVVDFGDLQLFEGVTTYPAILVLRKSVRRAEEKEGPPPTPPRSRGGESSAPASSPPALPGDEPFAPAFSPPALAGGAMGGPCSDSLRFLNLKQLPSDLSAAFDETAETMPRARLTAESWRFEGDRLDAIRAKMAAGRPTLAELYGPPLRGIVTGLNDAFVLGRGERDALITRDPRSAELLKPFLVGESLKRWRVESDDLWLIYTPRNRVDIEDYPAIRDHLAPYKDRLVARATKQAWWELQQAQAAYEPHFEARKLIWPHFQNAASFSAEASSYYLNNKCFFWPGADHALTAFLNSKAGWFALIGKARIKRGGYVEAEAQYVGALPGPSSLAALQEIGGRTHEAADQYGDLIRTTLHRLCDVASGLKTLASLQAWPDLDFAALRAAVAKRFRTDFPVAERDEWERWYEGRRAEAARLRARIADAEAEINARVYALYGLAPDEIAAVEDALAGQY